jgi:glycosyltransferase involved in cell wall biosynthesis
MSSYKTFVFVNNKSDYQSGGNIYNTNIADSLKLLGHEVHQTKDIYAKKYLEKGYILILDSIIIDEFLDLESYKNETIYFLIHLWPSVNKEIETNKRLHVVEKQRQICQQVPLIFAGEHSLNQCRLFYTGPLKKHFIIPPGVVARWQKKSYHSNSAINFLMIGNLCRRKRQLEVVKLFMSLAHPINLTLVGRHSERDYSKQIIEKAKEAGGRVIMNEEVEFSQMNKFILKFDAVISFSEEENNSMALLESIASGIPIITTPTGNYVAYKKQQIGHVLAGFDVDELSEAIIKMHTDPLFYKDKCESVLKFPVNTWSDSAKMFDQL